MEPSPYDIAMQRTFNRGHKTQWNQDDLAAHQQEQMMAMMGPRRGL